MKLDVYFDYACPYCLRGHRYLTEILPDYPGIEVAWHPCEAHPLPDRYGFHSDLCARGMYVAWDSGADLESYHARMYAAAVEEHLDIEDIQVLVQAVDDLLDGGSFCTALQSGAYLQELETNNRLAWTQYRFSAVPSLVVGDRQLRSVEDVGLTKEMIAAFLSAAYTEGT